MLECGVATSSSQFWIVSNTPGMQKAMASNSRCRRTVLSMPRKDIIELTDGAIDAWMNPLLCGISDLSYHLAAKWWIMNGQQAVEWGWGGTGVVIKQAIITDISTAYMHTYIGALNAIDINIFHSYHLHAISKNRIYSMQFSSLKSYRINFALCVYAHCTYVHIRFN